MYSFFVYNTKSQLNWCGYRQSIFSVTLFVSRSPLESVEVKVNGVVILVPILSEVAKVNGSI